MRSHLSGESLRMRHHKYARLRHRLSSPQQRCSLVRVWQWQHLSEGVAADATLSSDERSEDVTLRLYVVQDALHYGRVVTASDRTGRFRHVLQWMRRFWRPTTLEGIT